MNPSATCPVSSSARGPYPAIHTSSSDRDAHGSRTVVSPMRADRPLPSSRMISTDSASRAIVVGFPTQSAHRGVAAADPAHGSVAEHLVECGERRCRHRDVPRRRVGHIGPTTTVRVLARI